jgi:Arc/MetJ family transcription regulator
MAKTLVDIDERALRMAMAELDTTTKVDTVNQALREVAARREHWVEEFMEVAIEAARDIQEDMKNGISACCPQR